MSKWYEEDRADEVILSSYIDIFRSAEGYPFAGRLPEEKAQKLLGTVREALGTEGYTEYGKDMDPALFAELVATHALEDGFTKGKITRGLFATESLDEVISVGGESHICIHKAGRGLCADELYTEAEKTEERIGAKIAFAFDEKMGYLSQNPEHIGCGLTVGVRLHLPALAEQGSIRALTVGAGKLGITLRPDLGENAEALGDVYEITNQYSLGMTEKEVIARITEMAEQLVLKEKKLRSVSADADKLAIEDRAARAEGILSHARRITVAEAMELISEVRLGGEMGIYNVLTGGKLEALCIRLLPGVLDAENKLSALERSEKRAELLRTAFAK